MEKDMKHIFSRCTAILTAVLLTIFSITVVYAEGGSSAGINLVNAKKNARGEGYTWDNPSSTLTLDSLRIDTEDDFGLKIPAGARVILKGDSYIKAGKYGIGAPGSVTFEGDGSLTVEASVYAVYSYSTSNNHKIKFTSGDITFTAGECGIFSQAAEISVVGGSVTIRTLGERAADARVIKLMGGTVIADGSFVASHSIECDRAKLDITADGTPALEATERIVLSNVDISAGIGSELSSVDGYSDEESIRTVPHAKSGRKSIFFGENVSALVDYVLLGAAGVAAAALIVIPIEIKRHRRKKLYERLASENTATASK